MILQRNLNLSPNVIFNFSHGNPLKKGITSTLEGFPGGSEVKVPACNAGDLGLIPGSGRFPGE